MLPIVYQRVAGLDVHKKTVVATRKRVTEDHRLEQQTQTFGTTTPDLLQLHDWLDEWPCTHVTMESTADYWKPVYNLLEADFEVLVVNAQHVKHVPGRKTDVSDSEWLAELLLHGLLKASFIPAKPQRDLRELTRYRTKLVQERARVVNRLQKGLESANIKLASVVSDIMGVSARQMLAALSDGERDAAVLAQLARGQLRHKIPQLEQALAGLMEAHQRFLLARQLTHIDFLEEQIEELNAEIGQRVEGMSQAPMKGGHSGDTEALTGQGAQEPQTALTWSEAVALLDTLPGVDERTAQGMLAEMGVDMSQFPTDKQLASWAGLAPGNHESGGQDYSGRRRKGNQTLAAIMVQAAWGAVHTKGTFFKARYHRLAARRGRKRAIVAVAHSMLISAWHMLTYRQPYQELGEDYFDQRRKDTRVTYLTHQLEKLTGGTVRIELQPAPV